MKRLFITLVVASLFTSCLNDTDDYIVYEDDPIVAEFLPNLSDLNLFIGDLKDLTINSNTFVYNLNTELFTDYAHKLRIIGLPNGSVLEYADDGFPIFPTGTLMAKTFYYNLDETNPNSAQQIIETRVLIKEEAEWAIGNYVWNEEQTDAFLDTNEHQVKVDFVNEAGEDVEVDYIVPAANDCTKCHINTNLVTPIGPKLRTMNFVVNGVNQLQSFIDNGYLANAPAPSEITALPNWEDDVNFSLEERARAYFDINCAHCHIQGGFCDLQSTLDLAFETAFDDTNIFQRRFSISARMSNYSPGTSMPFIGTTMIHSEGYNLIQEYLDTLD